MSRLVTNCLEILLKGNFLAIGLLIPDSESDLILLPNLLKSLNNSKWEESLAVGTKLKPLLNRRI